MLENIFKAFCIVTIIFCVVTVVKKFIYSCKKTNFFNHNCFVIIKINDCKNEIEGIIRNVIWKSLSISNGGFIPNILVVDNGMCIETLEIVRKLMNDYSFIFYITT